MASIKEIKAILRDKKSYLKQRYGVKEIGIFGSYVHGQNSAESDLDVLVELERPPKISLIGIVELENYLSDLLAIKVDLAVKKNLRKRIGKRILGEVEYI